MSVASDARFWDRSSRKYAVSFPVLKDRVGRSVLSADASLIGSVMA